MTILKGTLIAALLAIVIPAASVGAADGDSPKKVSGQADGFRDRWVQRGPYRIHARERAGTGPTIVLMHGYPDNHHLYDRVVPHLRGRPSRVIPHLVMAARTSTSPDASAVSS